MINIKNIFDFYIQNYNNIFNKNISYYNINYDNFNILINKIGNKLSNKIKEITNDKNDINEKYIKFDIHKNYYIDLNDWNLSKSNENYIKNIIKINDLIYYYILIHFIRDKLRHITFTEYSNKIVTISNEIIKLLNDNIDKYNNIYFLPGNGNIHKSSVWVFFSFIYNLLNYNYITPDNNIFKNLNKIFVIDDILSIRDISKNENNKILIIYFDDMSYSGQQIRENLYTNVFSDIILNNNVDTYLGIPYYTKIAINTINTPPTNELLQKKILNNKNINLLDNSILINNVLDDYNEWISVDKNINFVQEIYEFVKNFYTASK